MPAWAVLWLGGAAMLLPWQFPPARVLQANLEEHSLGQPAWLAGIAHRAYQLLGAHTLLVPVALAAAEVLVGLGVLHASCRRPAAAAGILMAVMFWVVFQAVGGVIGGGGIIGNDATDPGAAPLLVILGLAMWPIAPDREAAKSPSTVRSDRRVGIPCHA